MRFEPTSEQVAVIGSDEPGLVVVASAGAGKTGTLVHRYLRMVREKGIAPDQILTITFTRKAAAEMKERIVASLQEAGLWEEAQVAETGPIQTIHGFCERLLRENAIAAGLDPEFDVLSETESPRLVERAVRRALSDPDQDNPHVEALMALLAGETERHGNDRLESFVRQALHELRGTGADFESLIDTYGNADSVLLSWQRCMLEAIPQQVSECFRGRPASEAFGDRLRGAFKDAEIKTPRWATTKVEPKDDRAAAEHACGLLTLACAAWVAMDREMTARQALDFAELERRAVALLENHEPTAERVRRQYRAAMVDEAQDVNPMQYRLLRALRLDSEMLVGDPQQSIYGFRQADVELFRARAKELETKELNKNWRSGPGILSFVDRLFGSLWVDAYRPMAESAPVADFDKESQASYEGVEIWLQRDKDSMGLAAYVDELRQAPTPLRDITVLVRGLKQGVELQDALALRNIKSRIVGGSERFYTRLEIRDLANALIALSNPYDDFALAATLRSPFCNLSLDAIVLLAKRSPIVETLKDFEPPHEGERERIDRFLSWFEPLSKHADRLPAWEVLSEIYASSGYLEALARRRNGDQLLANVRKLLSLATDEPDLGPAEYAARIREIQNLRHREGDAPAEDDKADMLTIMTVHKAKGLEFEVVVVPETHRSLVSGSKLLEIEPRRHMVVPHFGRWPSMFHHWLTFERKAREEAEELRVFYVALTRAKRRLCVVAHSQAKQHGSFAKVVASTFGIERGAPPGILIRDSQDRLEGDE